LDGSEKDIVNGVSGVMLGRYWTGTFGWVRTGYSEWCEWSDVGQILNWDIWMGQNRI